MRRCEGALQGRVHHMLALNSNCDIHRVLQ